MGDSKRRVEKEKPHEAQRPHEAFELIRRNRTRLYARLPFPVNAEFWRTPLALLSESGSVSSSGLS